MQIRQQCPSCQRLIKMGKKGAFLPHYLEGPGKWKGGRCIGSYHTVNQTKELLENASK